MSFEVKGWCPGALRPMLSGDGYVVRVRAPGGRLTQVQALEIARLSERHGNGRLDLSSRANLQIRGVTEVSHGPLIESLRALGLIDASAQIEARRNILVQPFWAEGDGTQELALELIAALPHLPALPAKFGFALDTGPAPMLAGDSADIRVERLGPDFLIRCDGAATGWRVPRSEIIPRVIALVEWFMASGGREAGRMARLLATGAVPPGADTPAPQTAPPPTPGLCPQGALIGLPFGALTAQDLATLGTGPIRLTPWRMILVEGETRTPAPLAFPLAQAHACTGAPDCPQGLQPTRALAAALATHLSQPLHVSGCAKGCAHPGPCAITLTGTARGYDLILNGTAQDTPIHRDLPTIDTVLEALHALDL